MAKVRIFISYARKDRDHLDRLLLHLAPMQAEGLIEPWTDLAIEPGDHWDRQIGEELELANIVLLLVSANLLASKYINAIELKRALERENRGEVVVIPVILNFADWNTAPFHSLQALPPGAKPIADWRNRDEAWAEVARALRRVIGRFHANSGEPSVAGVPLVIEPETVKQDRVLDAAMAARIPLGKPSDLSVMVRKTDSAGLKAVLASDDEFSATAEDVKSKPFQMEFARDPQGKLEPARLTVKLESPDFDPPEQSEEIVVPPDRDSDVCTFLLRPLFPGELVVKLKVFAADGTNAIRLMRIFSESSDRIIQGGRVIATIPISAVAAEVRPAFARAPAAMPAAVTLTSPPPAAPLPSPAALPPSSAAPWPVMPAKKRRWPLPAASAAAALVIVGTAVVQLRPPMSALPETASTKVPPAQAAADHQPPPAVVVNPVPTIPLPRHDGPRNPVANDSASPPPAETPRQPTDTKESEVSQAKRELSSSIILQNDSSHAIRSIYLQRSGESAWAADQLGDSVLAPGKQVTLTVGAGFYDLRLIDQDGNVCVVRRVSLVEKQMVTLTDSMVSQCAFQ